MRKYQVKSLIVCLLVLALSLAFANANSSDANPLFFKKMGRGFKKAGRGIKKAGKSVGRGVKKAGKAVGKGVKKAAKAVAKVAKAGWNAVKCKGCKLIVSLAKKKGCSAAISKGAALAAKLCAKFYPVCLPAAKAVATKTIGPKCQQSINRWKSLGSESVCRSIKLCK